MLLLEAVEISENTSNGKAIPMPKNKKFRIFARKLIVDNVLVNKAAMNNGLHGITIAPKKKPNVNELTTGFFTAGVCIFGRNLPVSISNIKNKLIISNMLNAIGEIIPITLVSDTCSIVVNNSPISTINRITPLEIITPKKAILVLSDPFPDS